MICPTGIKKAYIRLSADSDSLGLANKIGIIWWKWIIFIKTLLSYSIKIYIKKILSLHVNNFFTFNILFAIFNNFCWL